MFAAVKADGLAAVPALAVLVLPAAVLPAAALADVAEVFLVDGGCFMTLAAPGVGVVVQYHLPLARDQVCPSLAEA